MMVAISMPKRVWKVFYVGAWHLQIMYILMIAITGMNALLSLAPHN